MPRKKEAFPFPHEVYPDDWFTPLSLSGYFDSEQPLEIDLGCGDGTFTAEMAAHYPERNFLAIERLLGRVRKVNRKATVGALENLKVLRADSNYAVRHLLPDACARRIHFLCPDPWPKKKHASRRQMCDLDFLRELHRMLEENGELLFKTDHPPYFEEALEVQERCDFFSREEWGPDYEFYPISDFEKQWTEMGKTMHWLKLTKL